MDKDRALLALDIFSDDGAIAGNDAFLLENFDAAMRCRGAQADGLPQIGGGRTGVDAQDLDQLTVKGIKIGKFIAVCHQIEIISLNLPEQVSIFPKFPASTGS